MITYGFSVQGKSHIKNNTVCQDFNKFGQLKSGVYITASTKYVEVFER